jgi:hypothetical protein
VALSIDGLAQPRFLLAESIVLIEQDPGEFAQEHRDVVQHSALERALVVHCGAIEMLGLGIVASDGPLS